MKRVCPVCWSDMKNLYTNYDRGRVFSEKWVCKHCDYEYYKQEDKVWETYPDDREEVIK